MRPDGMFQKNHLPGKPLTQMQSSQIDPTQLRQSANNASGMFTERGSPDTGRIANNPTYGLFNFVAEDTNAKEEPAS